MRAKSIFPSLQVLSINPHSLNLLHKKNSRICHSLFSALVQSLLAELGRAGLSSFRFLFMPKRCEWGWSKRDTFKGSGWWYLILAFPKVKRKEQKCKEWIKLCVHRLQRKLQMLACWVNYLTSYGFYLNLAALSCSLLNLPMFTLQQPQQPYQW